MIPTPKSGIEPRYLGHFALGCQKIMCQKIILNFTLIMLQLDNTNFIY